MKISSPKAESLIETIVAITVIALGAVGVAVMMRTSLLGEELSNDRMEASRLAEEGAKALVGIRDTNILRYSGMEDVCWNTLDDGTFEIDSNNCDENLIERDVSYALKLDLEEDVLEYYPSAVEPGEASDPFAEEYRLYECPLGNGTLLANPSYANPEANGCIETEFYRNIYMEYQDTENPATSSMMTVTSTVVWITDGNEKTISFQRDITNR